MDDSQILSKGRISFKVCLEKFQYIDVRESSRLPMPAVVYIARQSHKGFCAVVRYFSLKENQCYKKLAQNWKDLFCFVVRSQVNILFAIVKPQLLDIAVR